MKRLLLPFIMLMIFISESIYADIVPSELFGIDRLFIPHFILIALILISIFLGRMQGILYGAIFGFLFDIVYTGVLGVYAFLFPVVSYITFLISKVLQANLVILIFCSVIGISILEFCVFGLYYLIGNNGLSLQAFLSERLLPTVILNMFFMVLFYFPFRRLLFGLVELKSNE